MIRICPERDGPCPHGDDCPHTVDRYSCNETAPPPVQSNTVEGLEHRIFQQRRRIRNRLKDDPRWPLSDDDRSELTDISNLLADIERALASRPPMGVVKAEPVAWLVVHPEYGDKLTLHAITDGDRSRGWSDTPLYTSQPTNERVADRDAIIEVCAIIAEMHDHQGVIATAIRALKETPHV